MQFDADILATRSWSLPALCALLDLHQDFDPPRHVALTRIAWTKRSCSIGLEYGTQNVSGTVLRSAKFSVSLHKNGIVSMRAADANDKEAVMLAQFIAGEIERQARIWMENLEAWCSGESDEGTEAVCCLASGIAGLPEDAASLRLHRLPSQRRRVHRIVLLTRKLGYELSLLGRHGLCWYVKDSSAPQRKARLLQLEDVRQVRHVPAMQQFWIRLKESVNAFLWVVLVPLDMGSRFLERTDNEARRKSGL
jgi:hypothetical protein